VVARACGETVILASDRWAINAYKQDEKTQRIYLQGNGGT
jgi:hypothetical protein